MKYSLIVMALLIIGSACKENQQSMKEVHVYFDLDSLLDEQAHLLNHGGAELQKKVQMNGKSETKTSLPDTSGWQEEFSIIREFNLNKPYYVGLFEEHKATDLQSYEATGEDVAVRKFDLFFEGDALIRIEALLKESKLIYSNERKLTLEFEDGLLHFFQVEGEQKMIFQDKKEFVISGSTSVK